MIPAEAIKAAEESVVEAMIKHGPDGHIDGYEQIARAALEAAAPVMLVHVHHHDIENHAASFNEGYETAVAQGLADDPTLAGDWLDSKLADAYAQGWRNGKGIPETRHVDTGELLEEPPAPEWNPYRKETRECP